MIIKLDGRYISDIKALMEYIVSNHSTFEIELIQNVDEWLHISCEDFYISLARKENKLINYYSDIKQSELYEILITQKQQNVKKRRQSTKKSLKNLFIAFLLSIVLLIIQNILVIKNSTYNGNIFEKLLRFYLDSSVTPYQKSIPLFVIVFLIFCTIYSIKAIKEKKEADEITPPEPTKEEALLTEIRDILKEKNK